jgi:hypothetical protein
MPPVELPQPAVIPTTAVIATNTTPISANFFIRGTSFHLRLRPVTGNADSRNATVL